MGTKKIDKEFLWLKVLHIIEDLDEDGDKTGREIIKRLNKKFSIKERKKDLDIKTK